ncbi:MAG: hypothetical protein R2731_13115 [Nocardioides sp.]
MPVSRRTRRTAAVAALAGLCTLTGSCAPPVDGPRPKPTLASTPAAAPGAGSSDFDPTEEDFAALTAVLRTRSRAVRQRDEKLFLSVVDRRDPSFVRTERTLYANLTSLPLAHYSVDAVPDYLVPDPVPGASALLAPSAVEHVKIQGVDVRPAGYAVRLTFVRRGDRWLIGGERADDQGTLNEAGVARPWFGPALATRVEGTTVLALDRRREARADELMSSLRSGIASDAEVLGMKPTFDVFVDATSRGALSKLNTLDTAEDAAAVSFAAVTLDPADDRPSRYAGERIKLNPHYLDDLVGDEQVLRHELTHFLMSRYGSVPRWLSEGLAEYVARYPHPPSDWAFPPDYYRRIQQVAGDGPPVSGLFGTEPFEDYTLSWCAVSYLVRSFGMTRVKEFIGDFRPTGADVYGDDQVNRLLKKHFGISRAGFVGGTAGATRSIRSG